MAGPTNPPGLRDNFDAVAAPGPNDDATLGYRKGSRWLNNTSGILRLCLDATPGAARWEPLSPLDHPGYQPNRFYPFYEGAAANATAPGIDTLYLTVHYIKAVVQARALAFRVTTAGSADSAAKLALWGSRGGKPFGPPLLANNDGAPTSAVSTVSLAVSGTLDPGVVWVGRKLTGGTLPAVISHLNTAVNDACLAGRPSVPANAGVSGALTFASPYADPMPTFADGATFGDVAVTGVPIVHLHTAG